MSGTARLPVRRLLAGCVAVIALVWASAAGAAATAGAAGATPKPARVTVNDFYFGPSSVTIRKGASVKWVWSSTNSYPHDVHLKKGPRGLRNRASYSTRTTAVTEARFQKRFPTAGTYRYICTVHPTEMHLTVTVKK